jgi:hypothetical protein
MENAFTPNHVWNRSLNNILAIERQLGQPCKNGVFNMFGSSGCMWSGLKKILGYVFWCKNGVFNMFGSSGCMWSDLKRFWVMCLDIKMVFSICLVARVVCGRLWKDYEFMCLVVVLWCMLCEAQWPSTKYKGNLLSFSFYIGPIREKLPIQ